MKNKNLPNRLTNSRLVMSIIIIIILVFPFDMINVSFKKFLVNNTLIMDTRMIIVGVLFILSSITDFLDGHLARKYNLVTDIGKVMDAIADKILVNAVLIVLAVNGYISVVVPVVIVSRDIIVDSIKMVAGQKSGAVGASKTGKIKTACMMSGITLLFFYNLPFSLININPARALIMIATVLSVISGVEYYIKNKKYLINN